jgi:hypothetical protein
MIPLFIIAPLTKNNRPHPEEPGIRAVIGTTSGV